MIRWLIAFARSAIFVTLGAGLLLAACTREMPSAGPSAGPTSTTRPGQNGTSTTPIPVDAEGNLALPTTTNPAIELPAAVSRDLELAGADAEVLRFPDSQRCTLVITLTTEKIGFAFDSAELNSDARRIIELVAVELAGTPSVTVVGYSSSEGDPGYNIDLSRRRAQAVAETLQPHLPGIPIATEGRGAADPIADNATEEGRVQNRRVVISGDVQSQECGI